MMKQKSHLTKKEYEVMKVLWNSEKPLLISDLLLMTENVAENSLHPMVKSLLKKGYIKVVGNMKVAKTQSRFYAPALTVDEYAAIQLNEIFSAFDKKFNFSNFLAYFASHNKRKSNLIVAELENFLDEYKKQDDN
ncbi:MAG: BlaI/MecI/CopY family transcriptional regulator [Clostridia bacterium]|nr:BlaI/MecI/CopY family transcriptional regulator [Clostridia bacterium]